jgi:hypothetical protein
MLERDWDNNFELSAWQAQDRTWRKQWLEDAWRRERDADDVENARRRRYERGQTAWDIGLDPLTFDITLSEAVDQVKPEHWDGIVFGSRDTRHRVLSALLANAGLRRVRRLAPREVLDQAIAERAACVAWQRALALDRASGTHTARYEPPPTPTPVIRPEFVVLPGQNDIEWSFYRVKHEVAEPFQRWDSRVMSAPTNKRRIRALESGYVALDDNSLPRADLVVTREPWGNRWATPSETALLVHVANTEAALLFDWQVRRPAYFDAGAHEIWVIDTIGSRLLRQRRGEQPTAIQYADRGQTVTWHDEAGFGVVIKLHELFGQSFTPAGEGEILAMSVDANAFDVLNAAELARLQRFDTPWTIGHTAQWFRASIGSIVGRFKDEMWSGTLFGPEHQRDMILSALMANVGLCDVLQLAPIELWQQAA